MEGLSFDVDKIVAELMPKLGGDLGGMIGKAVDEAIKAHGLDRVDRKYFMFGQPDERERTPQQRAIEFLRGAINPRLVTDPVVMKALSEGTDSAGGYLVPTEYIAELVKRVPELSELFPYVRKIPVGTDAAEIPTLSTDVSITWGRAENASITESDAVFGQKTYAVRNMSALCYLSRELVADSKPAMLQVVTDLFAEAIAAERDKVIAIGITGDSQPEGIYSASGLSSVASIGALTYAKLVEIKYTLARKYHKPARWIMSQTNLQRITALKDDNSMPIIQNALDRGELATILGKPFSIQDDLPDDIILFGDLGHYWWFDREQMVIESTTTGGDTFAKHQVGLKVVERCDGKLVLAAAMVKGTGITS